MMAVAASATEKNLTSKEGFSPERREALGIEIARMHGPKSQRAPLCRLTISLRPVRRVGEIRKDGLPGPRDALSSHQSIETSLRRVHAADGPATEVIVAPSAAAAMPRSMPPKTKRWKG